MQVGRDLQGRCFEPIRKSQMTDSKRVRADSNNGRADWSDDSGEWRVTSG